MFLNYFPFLTADQGGSSGWMLLIMVAVLIVFFWFTSRSNKKREQEIRDMRDNLVVGDEITTIGGIIGKVVSIKEETCMIETGKDKFRLRILKSAVRCVDVPNEAARELLAKQRAEEAEKEAAERAAKEEEARAKKLEEAQQKGKKKGKKKEKSSDEVKPESVTPAEEKETPVEDIDLPEMPEVSTFDENETKE